MYLGLKQLVGQPITRPSRECTLLSKRWLIKCVRTQRTTCDAWTKMSLVHGVMLSHLLMARGWHVVITARMLLLAFEATTMELFTASISGRDDEIKEELYRGVQKAMPCASYFQKSQEWTLLFSGKTLTPLLRQWQTTFRPLNSHDFIVRHDFSLYLTLTITSTFLTTSFFRLIQAVIYLFACAIGKGRQFCRQNRSIMWFAACLTIFIVKIKLNYRSRMSFEIFYAQVEFITLCIMLLHTACCQLHNLYSGNKYLWVW